MRATAEGAADSALAGFSHVYEVAINGSLVAYGELQVWEGKVKMPFNRGRPGEMVPLAAELAIQAYVEAVNAGSLALNYKVTERGFVLLRRPNVSRHFLAC
ncbi:hypothetical protein JNW90_30730 [Micromonospora sp. STR1s_5]|nr:hypothetical protein [Micromonospora sp. STR1s_5]